MVYGACATEEDITRTKLLCETLIWVQEHDESFDDGRIRDEYQE